MKAADEGSPGTTISSSSSSSTWETVTVRPSRSNGTRARRRMRSVWSRLWRGLDDRGAARGEHPGDQHAGLDLGAGHRQLVLDALQLGAAHRRAAESGPSRASTPAPISRSGSTTRSTGRRRIDSSPSSVHSPPGCPASQPGSRRSSVPELPTSSRPPVASSARVQARPRGSAPRRLLVLLHPGAEGQQRARASTRVSAESR